MLKHALTAAAVALAASSAQAQTVLISEGFDDTATLAGNGWALTNLSSPIGTTGWFQGNSGIFGSQAGAAGSYIGADYLGAAEGGTLANWLISPGFSTAVAGEVTFWARGADASSYTDRIAFGVSAGSSSTGAFTLDPAVTLGGGWTRFTYGFVAQGAGAVGRFAIEYTGSADDSNYIGIDTFTVATLVAAPVPEPSTGVLMTLGLASLAAVARRRRAPA